MRGHAPLPYRAHAEALHRLGENHGRLAFMLERFSVCRVELSHIVTAAPQAVDVLIRKMRCQCGKLGVLAEKVLAVIASVIRPESLELTVHGMRECPQQGADAIARKQGNPTPSPTAP